MTVTRRQLCAAAATAPIAALVPRAASADTTEIQLMQAVLEPQGNDLFLSLSWEYDLPETLVDSLRRGIALYFVCEVRLQSKRTLWFDKDLGHLNSFSASVSVRLPVSIDSLAAVSPKPTTRSSRFFRSRVT